MASKKRVALLADIQDEICQLIPETIASQVKMEDGNDLNQYINALALSVVSVGQNASAAQATASETATRLAELEADINSIVIPDVSGLVQKSGDTITGVLDINKPWLGLTFTHPETVKGTAPDAQKESGLAFMDQDGQLFAKLVTDYNSNGKIYSGLYAFGLDNKTWAGIGIESSENGLRPFVDTTPPRNDNSNSIANTAFVRDALLNNGFAGGVYGIRAPNDFTATPFVASSTWGPYYGFHDSSGSMRAGLRYLVNPDKTQSLQLMLRNLDDDTWNPGYFSLNRDAGGHVSTSIMTATLSGTTNVNGGNLGIKHAFASLNIQSSTMLANTGNTAGNNGNDQIGVNFKDKNGTLIGDLLRVTGASGFEQLLLRIFCNSANGDARMPCLAICYNRDLNYAYMTGHHPIDSANDATLPTCLWVNNRITAVTGKSAAASAMLIAASAAPADIVEDALACVKEAARGAICHGFRFTIEGSEYHFTYDLFDQQNIADAFALAQAGEHACLFVRAESGEMVELALGPEVMKQLFAQAVNGHKNFYMRQCLERKQALAAAQSGEAIESLMRQWDLWLEYDERRKQRLIAAEMAAAAPGQTPDAPADLPEFPEFMDVDEMEKSFRENINEEK